jgi:hypothetical protein
MAITRIAAAGDLGLAGIDGSTVYVLDPAGPAGTRTWRAAPALPAGTPVDLAGLDHGSLVVVNSSGAVCQLVRPTTAAMFPGQYIWQQIA